MVARYPNRQAVKVAYNQTKPLQFVLEPGVESTQLQTLGVLMMSCAFFMAVLFNFILRQAMNEDTNAADQVIPLVLKTLFFPFKLSNRNPLIMGTIVGTAYCLSTLKLIR